MRLGGRDKPFYFPRRMMITSFQFAADEGQAFGHDGFRERDPVARHAIRRGAGSRYAARVYDAPRFARPNRNTARPDRRAEQSGAETPEEILDLPTPEKILGVMPRDALGRPKNETALARYYDRQEQLRLPRTNHYDYGTAVTATQRYFSAEQGLLINQNIWTPAGGNSGNAPLMNDLNGATTDARGPSGQARATDWSKWVNPSAPSAGSASDQGPRWENFSRCFSHMRCPPTTGNPLCWAKIHYFPAVQNAQLRAGPIGGESPWPVLHADKQRDCHAAGGGSGAGHFGPTNASPPLFTPDWKPEPPPWSDPRRNWVRFRTRVLMRGHDQPGPVES